MSRASAHSRETGGKAKRSGRKAAPTPEVLRQRRRKFWFVWLPLLILATLLIPLVIAEGVVYTVSAGHCHERAEDCPAGSVGLVLGCSKQLGKGRPNYYFEGRMIAAAELWKSGKVTHLIVSGDNSSRFYNEPKDMKEALVALGVPADRIICDYAGIRTYDSVLRARDIFMADKLIIVSQPGHVRRAVTIARLAGMEAEGFYAPLRPISWVSTGKQMLRERGARVAMVLDFLIDREPKFQGDKIPITGKQAKKAPAADRK